MHDVTTFRDLAARAQDLAIMAKGDIPGRFKTISANLVEFAEGLEKGSQSRRIIGERMGEMYQDTYLTESWVTQVLTLGQLDIVGVDSFFDAYRQLMESIGRDERPSTVESTAILDTAPPVKATTTVVMEREDTNKKERKTSSPFKKYQTDEGKKKKLLIALIILIVLVISAVTLLRHFHKGTSQIPMKKAVMKYSIDSVPSAEESLQDFKTVLQGPDKEKVLSEPDRLIGEIQANLQTNSLEQATSLIREMTSKYPRHPRIFGMVREVISGHMNLTVKNIEQKDWDTGQAHLDKARHFSLHYGFNTRKVEKLRERLDRLRYLDRPQDLVGKRISVDLKDGSIRNGIVVSASANNLTMKVRRMIGGGVASFVAKVQNSDIESIDVFSE
ncbi:MAG: hypothetical protein V2J25_18230 [Desulfatiglans sp.]|jgi:hypothetical protein|nr:hypothetical protein [Thermodesulfobacteriota bacterium]MEE4354801.1 hypothetical protein [Desulfatiglans sp.]